MSGRDRSLPAPATASIRPAPLQTFTDVAPLEEVAPPTSGGSVTYRFRSAGMYWFACPVDGHCEAGMLIKFVAA